MLNMRIIEVNGVSADEHKDVVAFLEKVCEKNIRIWPIAIDKEVRTPLEIISNKVMMYGNNCGVEI